MRKRLNVILSNGLCITSAKIRDDNTAILFITDYVDGTRVLFDTAAKRLLTNNYGIELSAKDVESISNALKQQ